LLILLVVPTRQDNVVRVTQRHTEAATQESGPARDQNGPHAADRSGFADSLIALYDDRVGTPLLVSLDMSSPNGGDVFGPLGHVEASRPAGTARSSCAS